MTPSTAPDYGLDAPGLVRTFLAIGAGSSLLALAASWLLPGTIGTVVTILAAVAGRYGLFMAGMLVVESRWVKPRTAVALLDRIDAVAPRAILDAGCGRGMMSVLAAGKFPNARITAIDIWSGADQSGNTPDALRENLRRTGLSDRVDVETGDLRSLRFGENTSDIIVSNWVVHNIEPEEERRRALSELWRVLRPGGTLLIADIAGTPAYAAQVRDLGAESVEAIRPNRALDLFRTAVSFGSFAPAALTALKPAVSPQK